MKGARIFKQHLQSLFPEDREATDTERSQGRDPELIEARNEAIMYRYHYYCMGDSRWEIILPKLAKEFYLSEVTMSKIIQENSVLRRRILNENPTAADMKKRFEVKW